MAQKKYYETLYDYLVSGGVGLTFEVDGRKWAFRIPTTRDFIGCVSYSSNPREQEVYLLSVCLSEVGGFPVGTEYTYQGMSIWNDTPKIQDRVSPYFWKSVRMTQDAMRRFEAFCYTTISRNLWEKWKFSTEMNLPIEGIERLRELTDFHVQWIAYNRVEDKKFEIEDAWSRSFFSASAMNPKGVEKVQRDWKARKEKEVEYRKKLIEKCEHEDEVDQQEMERLKEGKTFDDLREEYRMWVDGEEDDHDKIIREYKESLTAHLKKSQMVVESRQKELAEMQDSLQELNSLSMQSSPLRAYTDAEIQELVKAQPMRVVEDGTEYADHLNKRYLSAQEVIKENAPSLMQQVSQRVPRMNKGNDDG